METSDGFSISTVSIMRNNIFRVSEISNLGGLGGHLAVPQFVQGIVSNCSECMEQVHLRLPANLGHVIVVESLQGRLRLSLPRHQRMKMFKGVEPFPPELEGVR